MSESLPAAPPTGRLPVVDMARGAALVAMFAYHFTWDLAHFGYIAPDVPFTPQMRLFSHAIACAFLFIAGASLVLAQRRPFGWSGYWRRIAIVGGAAALVTAASLFLFPDAPILFGVLHCITAASLLALPFLFLPWPAAIAAAVLAAALPAFVAAPAFDGPWRDWTGLGAALPMSNDFRPLLPWAAALLAGVGAMAFALPRGGRALLARVSGSSPPARALAFGGRHSLLVYLVHQPVFFGLLAASVWAFGIPGGPADERPFRASCERQCADAGSAEPVCAAACGCAAQAMKRVNLWDKLMRNELDEGERAVLAEIARVCVGKAKRSN
ncbi:MAG: DUF1624 domain-containing protein [Hyphomicrobiales bacterium]|nr:DUF1624 domain-containing protein [Hyphomicrobiales bacterium]